MKENNFFEIETHPNPHITTYHVRCALLMREQNKSSLFAGRTLFSKTEKALQALRNLKGIEDAYCHNMYSLSVEKGQGFTWVELQDEIEDIVLNIEKQTGEIVPFNLKVETRCLRHGETKRKDAPCICGQK